MKKKDRAAYEEEMMYHIKSWNQSKQTQKEYCTENNLAYSTFIYWFNKFRRSFSKIDDTFITVNLEGHSQSVPSELELSYPNGVRLRISSVNLELIGRLIHLL